MAITINNLTAIDDNSSANLTQLSLSSFGSFSVPSNTAPSTTPPHAGTVDGYSAAGILPAVPLTVNTIQKFPFASDTNATNVGNLSAVRKRGASASSETHGYAISGDNNVLILPAAAALGFLSSIDKFAFASDSTSAISGSLNNIRAASGQGVASPTHGYAGAAAVYNYLRCETERFAFVSDGITTILGGTQYFAASACEFASLVSGFIAAGNINASGSPTPTPPATNTWGTRAIQKYMFASEADAAQVGDTTLSRFLLSGLSSPSHGYTAGGVSPTPVVRYRMIDKMSFATEGTSTYVGDLTANNGSTGAVTSVNNGYVLGGATSNNPPAPVTATNAIDKFPFATDSNATDVADLTQNIIQSYGIQN
jgi:hypothetical protein